MYVKNQWVLAATQEQMRENPVVSDISHELGVTLPTAQLLVNRGCTSAAEARSFLGKEEEQLHDPFQMRDMETAVYRILEGIENKEKIVIYGDYDVDGVTSVSCLLLYLREQGADVSYYIPCRSGEGYGVSEGAVRRLAADGCNLILTVDTGITAVEEARLARELGMTMIVTDHHECHDQLPEAEAVVNPCRPDCPYPFPDLAGVGVVFKLLCALESALHPADSMMDCVRRISRSYGDLVAIGTVADVMPIRDENRLIVSYGLTLLENTTRPGLIELLEAIRAESRYSVKKKVTASFIGYTIAPRINAAGRIRDASIAVELFLAPDCETAAPIARQLCDINRERQAEENKIVEEAREQIAASHHFETDPVLVLDNETWHHGIIGIVSSRITEKYACPSILISFEGTGDEPDGEDIGKGSGRSVKGLNLVEALGSCADLLEKYGGHELAAGLSIKRKNLPEFRRRLNAWARTRLEQTARTTVLEAECELTAADITMEQVNELYALEPYGVSNPVPVFVLRNVTLADTVLVGGGKHTRLSVRIGETCVQAMCFRQTLTDLDMFPEDVVDLLFTLDINEYQKQRNVQMIVKDVRLAEGQFDRELAERKLYRAIKQGKKAQELGLDRRGMDWIVPDRNDFAAVYSTLRRELRAEHEVFSIRALLHLLRSNGLHIGYVKLKYILMTFRELNLLDVEKLDEEPEIFSFRYIYQNSKTNLEKSNIYKKLKADFGQRM